MSTRPLPRSVLAGWWPVGALVAVTFALGLAAWLGGWQLGADSAVYRAGALTVLRGEPLYDPAPLSALPSWVLLPFTYPPAAALLFAPLAAVPAGLAWGVVAAASVLAVAVAVRVAAGSVRGRPAWLTRWPAVLGLTVLGLALEPVWKTLFLGQVNLILLAPIVVDLLVLARRDSRWAGVLVGVAAAVKLTPLIFIPHLLLTGRWRAALRALTTFVLLQGLMFLLIPRDAARYWTEAAADPDRVGSVHWIFNQSLHGLVSRASGQAPWSLGLAVGIGLLLALPSVWLVRRLHRRGEDAAALLVTAFLALLVSPVSWTHHWVWAVPLITVLVAKRNWVAAAAVTVLFGCCVVMLVPNGGTAEFEWGPVASVLGNAYVVAAALGIAGVAIRELIVHRGIEREACPAAG
jgi:alpha-1,2-mannosyltransferase